MQEESVITRTIRAAAGVLAPGHLGELTQMVDFALVDAVLEETGARERRLRLLPSRVVVYFVLALALFEDCSYQAVWAQADRGAGRAGPGAARRPPRCAGPAAGSVPRRCSGCSRPWPGRSALAGQPGVFYRGLRTVAVDGTCLHVPEPTSTSPGATPSGPGERLEFGYPLLRLLALVECGTRAAAGRRVRPRHRRRAGLRRPAAGRALDATHAAARRRRVRRRGVPARRHRDRRAVPGPLGRPPLPHPAAPPARRLLPGPDAGYGVLAPRCSPVRVIEAAVTVTLDDGTVRTEQWRLVTSLLDHARYPAAELVALYHERWQVETTYYSIKATLLDGRVLRSRSIPGIDQEVWALLTAYQALIRAAADTAATRPGPGHRPDQLHRPAADRRRPAHHRHRHPARPDPPDLAGAIGRAALAALLPAWRRPRTQARTRKNPTSKYRHQRRPAPRNRQTYTLTPRSPSSQRPCTPRTTLNATALMSDEPYDLDERHPARWRSHRRRCRGPVRHLGRQ